MCEHVVSKNSGDAVSSEVLLGICLQADIVLEMYSGCCDSLKFDMKTDAIAETHKLPVLSVILQYLNHRKPLRCDLVI